MLIELSPESEMAVPVEFPIFVLLSSALEADIASGLEA
jgi:hypothetical protein